jgi:hypothetical protein
LRHFGGGVAESGGHKRERICKCDVSGPQEDESRREGRREKPRGKDIEIALACGI